MKVELWAVVSEDDIVIVLDKDEIGETVRRVARQMTYGMGNGGLLAVRQITLDVPLVSPTPPGAVGVTLEESEQENLTTTQQDIKMRALHDAIMSLPSNGTWEITRSAHGSRVRRVETERP